MEKLPSYIGIISGLKQPGWLNGKVIASGSGLCLGRTLFSQTLTSMRQTWVVCSNGKNPTTRRRWLFGGRCRWLVLSCYLGGGPGKVEVKHVGYIWIYVSRCMEIYQGTCGMRWLRMMCFCLHETYVPKTYIIYMLATQLIATCCC